MNHQVDVNVERTIKKFLNVDAVENSVLTLDGLGANAALHYSVLSSVGYERLLKLRRVNVISASAYCVFCYLALNRGQFKWSAEEITKNWDRENRRIHGVRPGLTLANLALSRLLKRDFGKLKSENFAEALKYLVDQEFHEMRVADLPANLTFWLYRHGDNELIEVSSKSELREMPLADLIQGVGNIRFLFTPFHFRGERYSDPVFSPRARELYRSIRAQKGNHLMANMATDREHGEMIYLKLSRGSGKIVLLTDFLKFLAGVPNAHVGRAIRRGLYETEAIKI